MSLMSGKEMRFQVSPKTFRLDGWIMQRIWQWVQNRRIGDWESPGGAKSTATKPRNIQFATAGRKMLAVGNFRDWHAAVGEVRWSSVPKTPMNTDGKLVLHQLWNCQPVQIITQQPWKTTLVFVGSCDRTRCMQRCAGAYLPVLAAWPWSPQVAYITKSLWFILTIRSAGEFFYTCIAPRTEIR